MTESQQAEAAPRGRTRVAPRALIKVVAAVTADTLGVEAGAVDVDLDDDRGLLALTASAPVRVVSLTDIQRDPELLERGGGSLIERAAGAQHVIGERVATLTGARIGHVTIRLTGALIRAERRVR